MTDIEPSKLNASDSMNHGSAAINQIDVASDREITELDARPVSSQASCFISEASFESSADPSLRDIAPEESGASLLEYVFLAMLLSAVCIVAMTYIGQQACRPYSIVGSAMTSG